MHCDYHSLGLGTTPHGRLRLANVKSEPRARQWNARILTELGWRATALVAGPADKLRELIDGRPMRFSADDVSCTEYRPVTNAPQDDESLSRVEYRHPTAAECQDFLEWLQLSVRRSPGLGKIVPPLPSTEQVTEMLSVQIPAERVTVSVDTRPAREWL